MVEEEVIRVVIGSRSIGRSGSRSIGCRAGGTGCSARVNTVA